MCVKRFGRGIHWLFLETEHAISMKLTGCSEKQSNFQPVHVSSLATPSKRGLRIFSLLHSSSEIMIWIPETCTHHKVYDSLMEELLRRVFQAARNENKSLFRNFPFAMGQNLNLKCLLKKYLL